MQEEEVGVAYLLWRGEEADRDPEEKEKRDELVHLSTQTHIWERRRASWDATDQPGRRETPQNAGETHDNGHFCTNAGPPPPPFVKPTIPAPSIRPDREVRGAGGVHF